MYMDKDIKNGYNEYLSLEGEHYNTLMDVGLLVLDEGEEYVWESDSKEAAFDLLEGKVTFSYANKEVKAERPDSFHYEAWCLLVSKNTKVTITAETHSEIYVQATENERVYEPVMYTPDDVQTQHAGANNELLGTMKREIKTFFDYENAPFSNMVLGEILNYPGKWSSYPPHHHPQPEVYFHRFDYPQGFGASFTNGGINISRHNGLSIITEGMHSQVAAPGYTMCYLWGIRHLPGDPWIKTRIDDEIHAWLWKPDANDKIFQG
ncbi:MAG: 5-deoxy-glucuronate isomerase [Lachnospiraceae bacterium]|jgi:5-deoxy-glucuronate isomerase|nr:5-deoxy-glucuronate isomerase [Lachnospiraceae bacterium]